MKEKKRIPTTGDPIAWTSPFAVLKKVDLPLAEKMRPDAGLNDDPRIAGKKNRGRVDIIRQTAHRGGKTVTVVTGFTGISLDEKETLAQEMQTSVLARVPMDKDLARSLDAGVPLDESHPVSRIFKDLARKLQ